MKNSSNLFGDNKGKNLTLFSKSISSTKENKDLSSLTVVKEFINELNSSNSGITDSLCKLLQTIIKDDHIEEQDSDSVIMDNELLDLITDTIAALEYNFIDNILSNKVASDVDNIHVWYFFTLYYFYLCINLFIVDVESMRIFNGSLN